MDGRWTPLVVISAMWMAGCAADLPSVMEAPASPGAPWTDATATIWFIATDGCGFCDGTGDHPEAETVVVYRDGKVLWFASSGTWSAPRYDGDLALQDEVTAATESSRSDRHDGPSRIFATSSATFPDWTGLEPRFSALHARLDDPGPPRYNCDDGSAPYVEAFGPDVDASLRGNYEPDDAWGRLHAQLAVLRSWAKA